MHRKPQEYLVVQDRQHHACVGARASHSFGSSESRRLVILELKALLTIELEIVSHCFY